MMGHFHIPTPILSGTPHHPMPRRAVGCRMNVCPSQSSFSVSPQTAQYALQWATDFAQKGDCAKRILTSALVRTDIPVDCRVPQTAKFSSLLQKFFALEFENLNDVCERASACVRACVCVSPCPRRDGCCCATAPAFPRHGPVYREMFQRIRALFPMLPAELQETAGHVRDALPARSNGAWQCPQTASPDGLQGALSFRFAVACCCASDRVCARGEGAGHFGEDLDQLRDPCTDRAIAGC